MGIDTQLGPRRQDRVFHDDARAETIQTRPAFRNIFTRNRIIVVADGFYEWSASGQDKQPYRFQLKSQQVFAFAGLYDVWKAQSGEIVRSCTIITTTPNELTERVHDRMTVILDKEGVEPAAAMILQEQDGAFWPDAIGDSLFLHKLAVRRIYAKKGFSIDMINWAKSRAKSLKKTYLGLTVLPIDPNCAIFMKGKGLEK